MVFGLRLWTLDFGVSQRKLPRFDHTKRCNFSVYRITLVALHCLTLFSKIVEQRAKIDVTPIKMVSCVSHMPVGTVGTGVIRQKTGDWRRETGGKIKSCPKTWVFGQPVSKDVFDQRAMAGMSPLRPKWNAWNAPSELRRIYQFPSDGRNTAISVFPSAS